MARILMSDIAAVVGKRRNLASKNVEKFISMMFVAINEGLDEDKQVKVRGFGTFKVTSVKSRESVNIRTGERVVIEGHDKVSFTPDTTLRDLVNKPFAQFETVVLNENVNFSDEESVESEVETSSDVPDEPVSVSSTDDREKKRNDNMEKSSESLEVKKEDFDNVTEQVDSYKDTLDESREDFETLYNESRRRNKRMVAFAIVMSVMCLVIGVVVGMFFSDRLMPRENNAELASKAPESKVKKKQSMVVAKPVEKKVEPTVKPQEDGLDYAKMNSDSRVRIGAYDIVGIDTVVTLRSGQTMKSYCNATLGAGMLCYFQVLNDTNELGEGARLKVPKVRYKKKR